MPMKLLKKEWLQLLILITPFCAAALLWDKLPERFPVHWNAHGEVDGYGGKTFGVIFPAVLNLGLALLLGLLPRIDPKCRNYDDETKISVARIFKIGRLVLTTFLTCAILGICANALHRQFDMTRFAVSALALMFIVLGNFMGKLRPNYFMGFRTPNAGIPHRLDENAPARRLPHGRLRIYPARRKLLPDRPLLFSGRHPARHRAHRHHPRHLFLLHLSRRK